MRWYVSNQGATEGPMDGLDVKRGIDSGRFTRDMHVRDDAGGTWSRLDESAFEGAFLDRRGRRRGGSSPSRGVAAVLSFFFPGVGQIYKTQVFRGLLWMGAIAFGYVMLFVPGLVLHVACVIEAAVTSPPED